ncbi:putative O-linked N-acetylglucosamine transferase, SPINDLY family [Marinibacterium anthonyi]|nr:putative O-linked N-acetylglucosamine transferase, SPINDLY family [Marinibacterium anthonyi]
MQRTLDTLATRFEDGSIPPETRFSLAQAAYGLDELNESAVRAMMRCHAEKQNRPAALALYRDFYAFLETEMDTEPSLETQNLAVEIKLAEGSRVSPKQGPARSRQVRTPDVMIAVLPLQNLGPQNIPSFVLLGLLDQLTCHLANFQAPAVISSNTTRQYLDHPPPLPTLQRELNVSYAVLGSVRAAGNDVCMSMQLVETETGRVIWSKILHCGQEEMYDLNAPIAAEIAQAVVPFVNIAELSRIRFEPVEALEPFHLVLRAKEAIFSLARDSFFDAGRLLDRALRLSPHLAQGHTLMAEWHSICVWQGWSDDPAGHYEAIERHARQALTLSPNTGRAMALLGHSRVIFRRQYDDALRLFEQALDSSPNDAETLVWTVPTLAYTDNARRAVDNGQRTLDLSPFDPFLFRNEHFLSLAHYAAGDFDAAVDLGLSCFRRNRNYSANLRVTIAALGASGRAAEAGELVACHKEVEPGFSIARYIERQSFRSAKDRAALAKDMLNGGLPS